jgi:hypothetical protein
MSGIVQAPNKAGTKNSSRRALKRIDAHWGLGALVVLPCLPILAAAMLAGCLSSRPIAPSPEVAVVARQGEVPGEVSYEDLREAYTTSPNRDPDGVGVFEAIEPRSRMTLWVGELEAKREEANRIAYARAADEQAAVLAQVREFHAQYVVFEGVLLSPGPEFANARWYLPEGIYLVDDQGAKFKPERVDEGQRKFEWLIYLPPVSQYSSSADVPRWVTGYPRIVFPPQAITPQTKAVTLYFAAAGLRFSFTWIFDTQYDPSRETLGGPSGRGMNRLFGRP